MEISHCSHCGSNQIYKGIHLVECPTIGCRNFTQKQLDIMLSSMAKTNEVVDAHFDIQVDSSGMPQYFAQLQQQAFQAANVALVGKGLSVKSQMSAPVAISRHINSDFTVEINNLNHAVTIIELNGRTRLADGIEQYCKNYCTPHISRTFASIEFFHSNSGTPMVTFWIEPQTGKLRLDVESFTLFGAARYDGIIPDIVKNQLIFANRDPLLEDALIKMKKAIIDFYVQKQMFFSW